MTGSSRDQGCLCQGCGRRYRVDLLLNDELWKWIRYPDNPTLLCGVCIMERIEQIGSFDYFYFTKVPPERGPFSYLSH